MDPDHSPAQPRTTSTVVMQLLSIIILSFCLARRSYCRIVPRQLHERVEAPQITTSDRSHWSEESIAALPPNTGSITTRCMLTGPINRLWRAITMPSHTLDTTWARFGTFLTLLTSLSFVFWTCIVMTGVGLDSAPISYPASSDINEVVSGLKLPFFMPPIGCHAAEYICIFLYGSTKLCMYLVFIERVYIVSCFGAQTPRWTTKTYKLAVVGFLIYVVILTSMLMSRITLFTPTLSTSASGVIVVGICSIGLGIYGTVPIVVYETIITVFLTIMFLHPIVASAGYGRRRSILPRVFKRNPVPNQNPSHLTHLFKRLSSLFISTNLLSRLDDRKSPTIPPLTADVVVASVVVNGPELHDRGSQSDELKRLARRSLMWSLAGLSIAFTNIVTLVVSNGRREATACIRWCVADVVINAIAVFAVMSGKDEWRMRNIPINRPDVSLPHGIWGSTNPGASVGLGSLDRNLHTASANRDTMRMRREEDTFGCAKLPPIRAQSPPDDFISPISLPLPIFSPVEPIRQTTAQSTRRFSLQSDSQDLMANGFASTSSSGPIKNHTRPAHLQRSRAKMTTAAAPNHLTTI